MADLVTNTIEPSVVAGFVKASVELNGAIVPIDPPMTIPSPSAAPPDRS